MNANLKPITGFEGYFVDAEGYVWSKHRRGHAGKFGPVYPPQKLKANWTNKRAESRSSYLSVTLTRDDSHTKVASSVHVLVCTAFHGPKPLGQEVRHLDGNPENNRADNLAWGTRSQNFDDQLRHGRRNRGERHGCAQLTERQVHAIRKSTKSAQQLAEQYAVTVGHIYNIRSGRKAWRWLETKEP